MSAEIPNSVVSIRRTPEWSSCIFGECPNTEVYDVPILIKAKLLMKFNLYISPGTRACLFHLEKPIDAWDEIAEAEENLMDFGADHTNDIVNIFRNVLNVLNLTISVIVN
jgi:hypothetical protein